MANGANRLAKLRLKPTSFFTAKAKNAKNMLEEDLGQVLAQEQFATGESDMVAMGKVLFSTEACLALPYMRMFCVPP